MITIIIPTFGRAGRLQDVYDNIADATTDEEAQVVFVGEIDDVDTYLAVQSIEDDDNTAVYYLENIRSKNYAGAVNTAAMRFSDSDYFFLGADDLYFRPGWAGVAVDAMLALDSIKVVGTNDRLNQYVLEGTHATHYLVDATYIRDVGGVIDGDKGHILFEGYFHNYTDTEFIGTAKARAVFVPCLDSVVQHLHFTVGLSSKDATYEKGYANIDDDSRLYTSRQPLWWNVSR